MIKSPTATTERPQQATEEKIPFLQSGDRLTRAEFERRYAAQSSIEKAELIEGVVYVASPVHIQHGEPHLRIAGLVFNYIASTPGVRASDNQSLRLDLENEVQPDVSVWLDEAVGGQVRVRDDIILEGAPELVIEIAASSAAYDLHDKLRVYRRNGVREYLALVAHEGETLWHQWRDERYELLAPDEKGVLKSVAFPGLWLNSPAFWDGDLAALLATLQEGLQTAEHAAFVSQLEDNK
jgi:Uma2 family endonuclease